MRTTATALTLLACGCGPASDAPNSESPSPVQVVAAPAAPAAVTGSETIPPSPGVTYPPQFQALGTEPFWSLAVDGATGIFSTPENIDGESSAIVRRESAGALTATGMLAAGPLRLTVTRGTCSDGMSDTVYPFTARLTVGAEAFSGCARPGLPPR